jgi:DNA helicase-2/ATP-dependent DNA helicase PcrA
MVDWAIHPLTDSESMPAAYLEKLNPEQRRAVEHGVRENACAPGVPLLVIAGAGSGKTMAPTRAAFC